MLNLDEILLKTLAIVKEAGGILKDKWDRPVAVEHKGAIDLVTDADKAIEAFLNKKLRELLPEANFLGEESAKDMDRLLASNLCWVVDPIDGTTNFVHHVPMAAVSVALCRQGIPIVGIVDAPMLAETFYAARDTRAFCNGEPIAVSGAAKLTDALVATGFPYDIAPNLDAILRRLANVLPATQGLRRPGSAAIDLCWVAAGRIDAFYEDWLKPWDMAAGWLIVEEAGGCVTDFKGGPAGWNKPLLATNGRLQTQMAELL